MSEFAVTLLQRQFQELTLNPPEGISVGLKDEVNLFEWTVVMEGPMDTPYEGGIFKAELIFPFDFPSRPPTMRFISPMWHPNIFSNGCVCISILHPAGRDEMNLQEREDEKWRPIISVEAILLSVQSMLTDPNENSPANIDAAVTVLVLFNV
ncbi:hypothetical protein WA171_004966 [Blastocystis sp. BT1]